MYNREVEGILSLVAIPEKNILGVDDLTKEEVIYVHDLARAFGKDQHYSNPNRYSLLKDKVVYLIFDQPSTRTRESFKTAVEALGGTQREVYLEKSSMEKGESLADTLLMLENQGADLIVLRYDADLREEDLSRVSVPIINAGDLNEHPTQALLDSLVMADTAGAEDFTKLDSKLVFAGHTQGYRAAQSLAKLLSEHTKCKLDNLIPYAGMPMDKKWGLHSHKRLGIWPRPPINKSEYWNIIEMDEPLTPDEIKTEEKLAGKYLQQVEYALKDTGFLYIPRPTVAFEEKENMTVEDIIYRKQTIVYGITPGFLNKVAKPTMKIMHPLPRTGKDNEYTIVELDTAFDGTKWDLYYEVQPTTGIRVRQALLALMIGNK